MQADLFLMRNICLFCSQRLWLIHHLNIQVFYFILFFYYFWLDSYKAHYAVYWTNASTLLFNLMPLVVWLFQSGTGVLCFSMNYPCTAGTVSALPWSQWKHWHKSPKIYYIQWVILIYFGYCNVFSLEKKKKRTIFSGSWYGTYCENK